MSGIGDSVFLSQRLNPSDVDRVADEVFGDYYQGLRSSGYPGFWAIDIFDPNEITPDVVFPLIEDALGERPLLREQVEALFDAVTGARLEPINSLR